jgi:hypothetical protein
MQSSPEKVSIDFTTPLPKKRKKKKKAKSIHTLCYTCIHACSSTYLILLKVFVFFWVLYSCDHPQEGLAKFG